MGDGLGQIESLWMQAGGQRSAAAMAGAIAMAESSGQPGVSHRNSDGSIDRGLWQINSVHGGLSTLNRLGNARAAVQISGNGSNWRPWTTYTSGAYQRFLGAARAALGGAGPGKAGGGAKFVSHPGSSGSNAASMHAAAVRNARLSAPRPSVTKGLTPRQLAQSADQVSGDTSGGEDPNQALIDSNNARAEADKALADQLAGVKDELAKQTAFATSVANTSNFQLTKSLADLVSGRIVGYGVAGRAFTPGTGKDYAYMYSAI